MATTTMCFGNNSNTVPVNNGGKKSNTNETWKKVAIGGISAIAFGGAAYAATSMINDKPVEEENVNEETTDQEGGDATVTDTTETVHAPYHPSLQMATSVNDDMSFAEAFKAARAEVHAGGVFEWHGQVYGTYYGDEWDALSPADQSAFTASTSKVVHEHTAAPEKDEHLAQNDEPVIEDHKQDDEQSEQPLKEEPNHDTAEVTVTSIEYDPENEANFAYVTVDETEVVLADIDNDGVFDVMYVDENGNGEVEENEVYNITDENITVDGLGGYTEPTLDIDDDFLANNDTDIDSIEL